MTMRAEEIQIPLPVGEKPKRQLPPRVKPATWGEDNDNWTAETPGVSLAARPEGTEERDGRLYFPKKRYPTQDAARKALGTIYPSLKDASANPDGTYNLYSAELFTEGEWNGDPYTEDDLREIVRAHSEVGHLLKPWVKLGHDDKQQYAESHGMPRIGSIDNLTVDHEPHPLKPGSTRAVLRGDILNIPAQLYHAIEQKGYKTRSPEIYWNYRAANGKTYPRAMRATALLGAEMPGNPSMGDLFRAYDDAAHAEVRTYSEFDSVRAEQPEEAPEPARLYALDMAMKARSGDLIPGLKVRITHPKGMTRTGMGADGKEWRTKMKHDYGDIPGIPGADGDALDTYVGPHPDHPTAYMIQQLKADGTPDEEKAMLGFPGLGAARKGYLDHYPDASRLGGIRPVPVQHLIDRQTPPREEDSRTTLKDAATDDGKAAEAREALARVKGRNLANRVQAYAALQRVRDVT